MSRIDDKYIKALGTFTEALEEIVETLKDQQKKGTEDVVNGFVGTPMGDLTKVVDELKIIRQTTTKGFKDIKDQNNTILKKIESIKQQKESGMFDRIEDPKNKNKIVDGIKVVILIASGVLALGMAFKIIGKVDFLSVIALSGSIFIMAKTFSQLTELKNMKYVDIFKVASILPIMSLAILISAFLISKIPHISFTQGLSMIFVGGALGVATWLLLKSIKDVEIKDFGKVFLLPFVLPTISIALFLSALIIQNFPIIGFRQGLSLLFVGASLGIATWVLLKAIKDIDLKKDFGKVFLLPFILPTISIALFLSALIIQNFPIVGFRQGLSLLFVGASLGIATWILLKAIKNVDIIKNGPTIFALPWVLPVIALALTLSSHILQDFEPLRNPLEFIISTALIGISVLIFSPIIKTIGKMKFEDILKGTVSIPLVALAIVGAAYVFRELPNDMRYPDFMWSLGVGLSILVFAPILWVVGKFGLDKIIDGMIAIPLIALSIVLTAVILKLLPNEMKYPEIKWTLGTGLSLLSFGALAIGVGMLLAGPQALAFALGLPALLFISGTIVAVSYILGAGKYTNYPSLKWSTSVGLSLLAFSVASVAALAAGASNLIGKLFTGGTDPLVALAQRMVNVANKLNEVDWTSAKHPTKDYAEGVGGLLLAFAGVFAKISRVEGFNKIVSSLFGGGQSDTFMVFIKNATDAIIFSHDKLNSVDWSSAKHPSKAYAEGVGGFLESLANVFSKISKIEGFNNIVTSLFGGGSDNFMTFMDNASNAMLKVHDKLNVDWSSAKHPSKAYAEGVGGFLESLANAFASISKVNGFNSLFGETTSFTSFVSDAAQTMVTANSILSKVDWNTSKYPSKAYSEGVGSFLINMADAYSKLNSKGFLGTISELFGGGNKQTLQEFVIEASTSLVAASKILAEGNFSNIIDKKYVDGFAHTIIEMSKISKSIKNLEIDDKFSTFSISAATTISKASKILGDGNYSNIPDKKYTNSFSYFLLTYSDLARKDYDIQDFDKFDKSIAIIINSVNKLNQMPEIKDSMVDNMGKISESLAELGSGVDSFMHETPSGLLGKGIRAIVGKKKRDMNDFSNFSTALLTLVSALQILSNLQPMPTGVMTGYQSFLSEFGKLPDMTALDPKIESINKLSNSFASLAASLTSVNNNLDGFSNLSKGLFLISIIDDTKFDNVLKSVDKYKTSLQMINNIPSEQANLLSTMKGLYETVATKPTIEEENKVVVDDKTVELKKKQQFYEDVAYIRNILENIKDEMAKPAKQDSPWA
jgi:hypothetical protein